MTQAQYDIVVVGGGMVGLAAAAMLSQSMPSSSILLLDAKPQLGVWNEANDYHRVSAFAMSSQRMFKKLGVWQALRAARVSPFKRITVWDSGLQESRVDFDCRDVAEPQLGFIIENALVEHVLAASMRRALNVTFMTSVHISDIKQHQTNVTLLFNDHMPITASLVIAADGAHSWVRDACGIKMNVIDYAQKGLVATVMTEKAHQHVARQVFLPSGPLGFLPLQESHQSSIVWSLPNELAHDYQMMPVEMFKATLARAFDHALGDVVDVSERYVFPLVYRHANEYFKNRVVLIGDAAHTIHPMAGQGVNMGLLDAAMLTQVLCEEKGNLSASRVSRAFARYQRARYADNQCMLQGVHTLKSLFSQQQPLVKKARQTGLSAVNHLPWLKQWLASHAIGNRFDLPLLAQV